MSGAFVSIEDLSISFGGVKAIDRLSLEVDPGRIIALVGPNGAGKTTLFNLVCGYAPADTGTILVGGKATKGMRPGQIARLGVGRSFQDCKVFDQMPVLDNVLLGMREPMAETITTALFRRRLLGRTDGGRTELALGLLEEALLSSKADALACDLSYGQRKLLELCRVRAFEPMVYLLDEPFSGLFPEIAATMEGILRGLRDAGKTIVFIEHDMRVVEKISDRVVALDLGRKIADGPPSRVLNDPAVLEAYLGGQRTR